MRAYDIRENEWSGDLICLSVWFTMMVVVVVGGFLLGQCLIFEYELSWSE